MDNIFVVLTLILVGTLVLIYLFAGDKRAKMSFEDVTKEETYKKFFKEPVHRGWDIEKQYEMLPYRQKTLLTKTEYEFAKYLVFACSKYHIRVCPKVRMEDFIDVTTEKYRMKYRGHIKSRHVDFLLCDLHYNLLCAVELDDNSHNTAVAAKTDALKNRIYKSINLRLFRVKVSGDWKRQIVEIIKYCAPLAQKVMQKGNVENEAGD